MVCAKGVNLSVISLSNYENQYNLKIKSKFACPYLQFSAIWDFITTYRWFFIIIMVGVGIIECFFGRRLLNPTFFITGFGTGAAICSVYFISLSFLSDSFIFTVDISLLQLGVGWYWLSNNLVNSLYIYCSWNNYSFFHNDGKKTRDFSDWNLDGNSSWSIGL